MALVASLPMYDLPELRPAAEAIWLSMARTLRASGFEGTPARLTWAPPRQLWRDRELLFSQTCGYPLVHGYSGRLRPIATPCYHAAGCSGPHYRSAIVVRRSSDYQTLTDCRGRTCAVNSWDSLSGWQALAALVAPLADGGGFFGSARLTGSHLASAEAVASGAADLAAIDAICWAQLSRHRPTVAGALRVLDWTGPAPGLPFVTSADAEDHVVRRLRSAVFAMLADDSVRPQRDTLLLAGAEVLELGDYACVRRLAEQASVVGRPEVEAA